MPNQDFEKIPVPGQSPKKELSTELRLLIAFGLMGLVLFVTPYVMPKPAAPPTPPPKPSPAQAPKPAVQSPAPAAAAPASAASLPVTAAAKEQTYVIETQHFRVVFSNLGAVVKSWQLKGYKDNARQPVELVSSTAAEKAGWALSYVFRNGQQPEVDLNKALFAATLSPDKLGIEFAFSDGKTSAKKSLRFIDDRFRVTVTSEVTGVPHFLAWRGGFGDRSVHNAPAMQHAVYYDSAAAKLHVNDASTGKNGPVSVTGAFSFAGLEDNYFAAVYLPAPGASLEMQTWMDKAIPAAGHEEADLVGAAVGGAPLLSAVLFVGPKDKDILRANDPKLETIIDYGWFALLARPLFASLHWVNDHYVHNWGWSIVLVTVVINLLLLPLKFTSLRSMQKMQRLQPEIAKINEKYKGVGLRDPKKTQQNQEMMDLYQKHGINPVGGCLPLLLQMPFFFAFYKVLSVAIELRGAPWLWVGDLSQPEAMFIRILPIAMIITQVVMQKMTPSTAMDPTQQKMMLFMPIFLGVLFYTASSGLVLYWLTGNVVGIVQQHFFNKIAAKTAVPAPTKPAKKK